MKLLINHTTDYVYDQAVDYALQKVRLRPSSSVLQDVPNWELHVDGGKIETSYTDQYGNNVDLVSMDRAGQRLSITAKGTVETRDANGVLGKVYGTAPLWHFKQVTHQTEPNKQIKAWAKTLQTNDDILDGFHKLSEAVLKKIPYETGKTDIETTAAEALDIGYGVCQDHAHIFIAVARQADFPARYVSGYLMLNDQIDQDASHAWAEVHLDSLGWVGFDVSNGVAPDEKYVRIAIGRDAGDAAPISGMRLGESYETMIVSLQVQQ